MTAGVTEHRRFLFDDFVVDLDRGELLRDGEPIALRPKTFAVLRYLLERAGELVPREEILAAVWPGVVVTDDSIAQCLIEIRKALGDESRSMVRTIPRRGLMFDLPLRCEDTGPARLPTGGRRVARRPMLVIGTLAVTTLFLVSWGWRPSDNDGYAPQPRPVETRGAAATERHEPDPTAYRLVIEGQALYRQRAAGDLQRARDLFQRAATVDPDYGLAWARLAATLRILLFEGEIGHPELIRVGLPAATRALELRPDLAEVQFRAGNYADLVGDHGTALAFYEAALRIEPENPLVLGLIAGRTLYAGDLQRAVALQERLVRLDPLDPGERTRLVHHLFVAGRFDAMRHHAAIALGLNPGNVHAMLDYRLRAAIIEGDHATAQELLDRMPAGRSRDQALALLADGPGAGIAAENARERLAAGSSADAAVRLAEVHAWTGDTDAAFAALAAAQARIDKTDIEPSASREILSTRISPFLEPLHADPRWDRWLAELPLQDVFGPSGLGGRQVAMESP